MVDKVVNQQVLGSLMKRPQILSEIDKYNLEISDFSTKFEKYIFYAICGLYDKGATNITPIDIENYLSTSDAARVTFESQNGIEYLEDIEDLVQVDNFQYYYEKLKKINLLRDLNKEGIDTSNYYSENLITPDAQKINERFEQLTPKDILDSIKKKVLKLEVNYSKSEEVRVVRVADNFREYIKRINDSPRLGITIQGDIYSQAINGAEAGALTIRSGASGTGKTRNAVADACYLAFPIRYNSKNYRWEQVGNNEKVLFIITEQTVEQINDMILAYLTDINTDRFKYGNFSKEELILIEQAAQILDEYADNFYIIKMPNPTIELIRAMTREHCLLHNTQHVFYDYIFIGPALLNEFRGFKLRDDEVLLMFATALKDLAVELDVSMFTSTQVNSNADSTTSVRNESSLSGGRATINKADNGAIMARPSKEELEILEPITKEYGIPNLVTDVFKVRSGKWTNVRIWSIIDLGTMRKRDLFITDAALDPLTDFFETKHYTVCNWEGEEQGRILDFVNKLNGKV